MLENKEILDYSFLLKLSLISVITAVSTYIFIFFFSNYASLFFANDSGIAASFNLSGISFPDEISKLNWSRDEMITILLSKPISSFVLGFFSLFLLMVSSKKPSSVIMLLFWLNIFAFNSAFGLLIDDAFFGIGTYNVATLMNISNITLFIMAVILAYIFLKLGLMNGRLIIISFPSQSLSNLKTRVVFFAIVFTIPLLLIILYSYLLSSWAFSISGMLKFLPVVILLIPFLTAKKPENTNFQYTPAYKFSIVDIIISLLLIAMATALVFWMKSGVVI